MWFSEISCFASVVGTPQISMHNNNISVVACEPWWVLLLWILLLLDYFAWRPGFCWYFQNLISARTCLKYQEELMGKPRLCRLEGQWNRLSVRPCPFCCRLGESATVVSEKTDRTGCKQGPSARGEKPNETMKKQRPRRSPTNRKSGERKRNNRINRAKVTLHPLTPFLQICYSVHHSFIHSCHSLPPIITLKKDLETMGHQK